MKTLIAVASVLAFVGVSGCGSQDQETERAIRAARGSLIWAEPATYHCYRLQHIFGCPEIIVKVVPRSGKEGGLGGCQPTLKYDTYIFHGGWKRKIYWKIDDDSTTDFQFADTSGVVIDRNFDASPEKSPAFLDGKLVEGKFKYHYKSSGEYTLPPTDPSAPGFWVNAVRRDGRPCGPVDPPIVNQP